MSKIVCLDCGVELKPAIVGIYVIETHGRAHEPWKIWHADLYQCSVCGVAVIQGFANKPVNHFELEFDKILNTIHAGTPYVFHHEFAGGPKGPSIDIMLRGKR